MQVGDTFEGGYRIVSELGRGSTATVFLGEHVEIGQRVAIKLMHAASERVTREGRVLAKLSSPNTVRLLAFGRTAHDEQYMIFEWVEGEPLNDFITRSAPVDWEQVREIVRQILVSLAEAHAQNITHRDVKPGNLMVNSNLDVKVLDFGVAKVHDAPSITAAHQVPGTPRYMAPEVLRTGKASASSDIFAVGLIAHELLTGWHPNAHRELDEIIHLQLAPEPYTLPADLDVPHVIRSWFERMMAKDAASRFADANEALAAMPDVDETTLEQQAIRHPMPAPRGEETQEARVVFDTGDRSKPDTADMRARKHADRGSVDHAGSETAGREKNRPPSKFLWPTMQFAKVDADDSWSVTVLLGGLLLFASLVLAGLYQAGAFDPPKVRDRRPNPLVPTEPVAVDRDAGPSSQHMSGALKGIKHFEDGDFVAALKEFHKIEQGDNPIEKERIERGNYPQLALDAIADKAEKAAAEAESLEQIEAAAHDPQVAQSLYRSDVRINRVVNKLREMGREAEEEIARKQEEERKKARKKKR